MRGDDAYDRATLGLQRALEKANGAAADLGRQLAAGIEPATETILEYRRHSAALRYAEAVWSAEAGALVDAGTAVLTGGTDPRRLRAG